MMMFHNFDLRLPPPILLAGGIVFSLVFYGFVLVIYRLYLSPIAGVPGPKLAAATQWYEHYYDLIKDGQWSFKVRELHSQYGPVVRINPREVHIMDPDYIDKLFSRKLDKDPMFSKCFGLPNSAFGTASHDVHRQRRGALSAFFSKAAVTAREEATRSKILKLCDRLKESHKSGEIVKLDAGLMCLSVDIITELAYGVSYNYLDVPGFDREWQGVIETLFAAAAISRPFPWSVALIYFLVETVPRAILMKLLPHMKSIARMQDLMVGTLRRFGEDRERREKCKTSTATTNKTAEETLEEAKTDDPSPIQSRSKWTIFDHILESKLPASDKTTRRMTEEAQVIMSAGSETTARTLNVGAAHLLLNQDCLSRLRQELLTLMPEPTSQPACSQLEQLPYFTACIRESLRLAGGASTRFARMSPRDNPIEYAGWVFPPGTPVSMTLLHLLSDENIFPEPEKFDPMRWLIEVPAGDSASGNAQQEEREAHNGDVHGGNTKTILKINPSLDKYMVAFSRGPRMCLGQNFAYAVIYLTFSYMLRRFDMRLEGSGEEDVKAARDYVTPFAKKGNKGVMVRVVGVFEK